MFNLTCCEPVKVIPHDVMNVMDEVWDFEEGVNYALNNILNTDSINQLLLGLAFLYTQGTFHLHGMLI